MDNQYGIGVNNRYDLFLAGEDDSFDILRSRAATKEPKKKSKVAEKENKPIQPESKSKTSTGAREGIKETSNLKNVSKKTDAAKPGPKPKVENAKSKPDSDVKKPKFDSVKPALKSGDSREERNNRRNQEDRPERRSNQSFNRNRDSHDGADSKPDRFGDRFGENADRPERSERPERRERSDRFGDRFGENRGDRFGENRERGGDRFGENRERGGDRFGENRGGDRFGENRGEGGRGRGRGDRPYRPREDREDRGERGDRGERPDRGDRADRPERFERFERFETYKDGEGTEGGEGGRGRGRGMGRGRGRGRGGFEGRGGRRDFDRQSRSDRTGVKPVDKREGGGSHNWGTHRDEMDDTVNNSMNESIDWSGGGNTEDSANANEQSGKRNRDDQEPTTNGDAQQEPPEPKELTLEEWKALKGTREKPQYNIRKAGEGEDLTQYKNMVVLNKKSEPVKPSIAEHPDEPAGHAKQSSKRQNVVDINLHFSDNRTLRGRGGRGGGRGRRADDTKFQQNREPKVPKQSAPKVDDEHDFPSLG